MFVFADIDAVFIARNVLRKIFNTKTSTEILPYSGGLEMVPLLFLG